MLAYTSKWDLPHTSLFLQPAQAALYLCPPVFHCMTQERDIATHQLTLLTRPTEIHFSIRSSEHWGRWWLNVSSLVRSDRCKRLFIVWVWFPNLSDCNKLTNLMYQRTNSNLSLWLSSALRNKTSWSTRWCKLSYKLSCLVRFFTKRRKYFDIFFLDENNYLNYVNNLLFCLELLNANNEREIERKCWSSTHCSAVSVFQLFDCTASFAYWSN